MRIVKTALVMALAFGGGFGCGNAPFPQSPSLSGIRTVPFVPTYNFNFRTNSNLIGPPDGNLQIISASDLLNLLAAANVSSVPGAGVAGGVVVSPFLGPVAHVTLVVTDWDGKPVGEFFYNNLGGVPTFQEEETSDTAGFTVFNLPPGEVFFKALKGARGTGRVHVFPGAVSLTTVDVLPVVVAKIGVSAPVTEMDGKTPAQGLYLYALGMKGRDVALGDALAQSDDRGFLRVNLNSESDFVIRLSGTGHRETYQEFYTNLGQLQASQAPADQNQQGQGAQVVDLTLFLNAVSEDEFARYVAQAAGAGVGVDPARATVVGRVVQENGTPRANAVVRFTDPAGNPVGDVFYMDSDRNFISGGKTGLSGKFVAFNLPPGRNLLRMTAVQATGGTPEKHSGGKELFLFGNGVYYYEPQGRNIPFPDLDNQGIPPRFTITVQGQVFAEDGVTPVPDTGVQVLGTSAKAAGGSDGSYTISDNVDYESIDPILRNVGYIFRVCPTQTCQSSGQFDTYQTVVAPGSGTSYRADLRFVRPETITQYAGVVGGIAPNTGVILGHIRERRTGRTVAGIKIRATNPSGEDVGTIVYFSPSTGLPFLPGDSTAYATSNDGRFAVFNVPIPRNQDSDLILLSVVSEDDTGNSYTIVPRDGVMLKDLFVSDAPPSKVVVSGKVANLAGSSLAGVRLTIPGGDLSLVPDQDGLPTPDPSDPRRPLLVGLEFFTTDSTGTFAARLSPLSEFLLHGRKDGYLSTTYYSVFSGPSATPGQDIVMVSESEWKARYRQAFPEKTEEPRLPSDTGFILGEVITPDFAVSPPYTAGPAPGRIVQAALNGDAYLDVALTHPADNRLTIHFGTDSGTLAPSTQTCVLGGTPCSVGRHPSGLAAADFNGDGSTDLAVVNELDATVSILLGNPEGMFRTVGTFAVGGSPRDIAVADMDRNGAQDLIVVSAANNAVWVLLGDGAGQFPTSGPFTTVIAGDGSQPRALATAEVDRDGIPDVVVATADALVVLLKMGRADLDSEIYPIPQGADLQALASADLDRNGWPDVVAADTANDKIVLYLRDQEKRDPITGRLQKMFLGGARMLPETEPLGGPPIGLLLADVDQDADLDIVTAVGGNSPRLLVLLGNGKGEFPNEISVPLGPNQVPAGLVSGDFSGDLLPDLAVALANGEVVLLRRSETTLGDVPIGATDIDSRVVGEVKYFGLDCHTIDPTRNRTAPGCGRFAVFNVPEGQTWLRTLSRLGQQITNTAGGNRIVQTRAGETVFARIPVIQGGLQTAQVAGYTLDSVRNRIGSVSIEFLGMATSTFSSPVIRNSGGFYTTELPANSDYIVRLTRSGTEGAARGDPGDRDSDSILDIFDVCPLVFDPAQLDADNDGIGDACDPDTVVNPLF